MTPTTSGKFLPADASHEDEGVELPNFFTRSSAEISSDGTTAIIGKVQDTTRERLGMPKPLEFSQIKKGDVLRVKVPIAVLDMARQYGSMLEPDERITVGSINQEEHVLYVNRENSPAGAILFGDELKDCERVDTTPGTALAA